MATTDARTGFRLPWSTDQKQADDDAPQSDATAADEATSEAATGAETDLPARELETESPESSQTSTPARAAPSKKPNKFLADLTKAMQAAAEAAREESVSRFAAEAKTFVEQIHVRSAEESADLRRKADDDVSAIRDWSKAEIARIREETEQRITNRKSRLEREVEQHAALIEHEIERLQGRVAEFEAEMARFFERLLAEEDPSRFAAMAENLPEPPSFDVDVALAEAATLTLPETEPAAVAEPIAEDETEAPPAEGAAAAEPAEAEAEAPSAEGIDAQPAEDPEAAFAAIQAAAEAAAEAEQAEPNADSSDSDEPAAAGYHDMRLAALGLNADSAAAAEAEAFAIDPAAAEAEEIPVIADDALAARLAGLVPPADGEGAAPSTETHSTQVVVVGLVSVASIASFKRHLGRLPGVQAVGVSSGPDGEFVFAVTHGPEVVLSDVIPTLPGFQPRVTASGEGVVNVTAHDPESDA
jgi:hypothetical protein